MAPLYHEEALVHIGISSGRWAAARRDQGHGLSRWELATADRLWCSNCRAERGLDSNGREARLGIDCCGFAGGYVAARRARTGYSGVRPPQLPPRGGFPLLVRGPPP